VLLLLACAAPAGAADSPALRFFRERTTFEWLIGAGGWRSSMDPQRPAPGFDVFGGGGEVIFGLDFYGSFGVVASGRFLAGVERSAEDQIYWEGTGSFGFQFRASERVRLRLGGAAGELRQGLERGVLGGGFVAGSIGLFGGSAGTLAMVLTARLDLDALVSTSQRLPDSTMGLALGLGLRY
jgi:hypothetical protein